MLQQFRLWKIKSNRVAIKKLQWKRLILPLPKRRQILKSRLCSRKERHSILGLPLETRRNKLPKQAQNTKAASPLPLSCTKETRAKTRSSVVKRTNLQPKLWKMQMKTIHLRMFHNERICNHDPTWKEKRRKWKWQRKRARSRKENLE